MSPVMLCRRPSVRAWVYTGLFSGGSGSEGVTNEVLRYDAEQGAWVQTSELQQARYGHGCTKINWNMIKSFCV